MPTDTPTLFNMTPRCFACLDMGFELTAEGMIVSCWRKRAGAAHNDPNAAASMICRAVNQLRIEQVPIDKHLLEVSRVLALHTTASPCRKDRLIGDHFSYTASSLRVFHQAIETLRRVWLLPVASRKDAPSGYWIATDSDDFADYVARAKAAPITQLTTIYRLAKRNFPVFAEQLELEFWNNIEPQPLDAAA